MRFELHAKSFPGQGSAWVEAQVRVLDEGTGDMRVAGVLILSRAEWEVFWKACEMGGGEAGVDILAYEPELAITRGAS